MKVQKHCLHHSMISATWNFKITGGVFGRVFGFKIAIIIVYYYGSIFFMQHVGNNFKNFIWTCCRVDLGTSDYFAMDVLLNCLTVASSE